MALPSLCLVVTVACVPTGLGSNPRADGTAAPKHRMQNDNA